VIALPGYKYNEKFHLSARRCDERNERKLEGVGCLASGNSSVFPGFLKALFPGPMMKLEAICGGYDHMLRSVHNFELVKTGNDRFERQHGERFYDDTEKYVSS
jgi:hypothetical protein